MVPKHVGIESSILDGNLYISHILSCLMNNFTKLRRDGFKQIYHLSPLRPKIKKLYLEGLSSREVGKRLGISHVRVLALLKKENIDRRSITKIIPNQNYKQLTPERAYILGVMCGDGCVFSGFARKKNWQFKLYIVQLSVKDKDFIDEYMRCFYKVYGITPSLHRRERSKENAKWSSIWVAKVSRKEVYKDLSSYKFSCRGWTVPEEIAGSSNEKIISAFLRGFYDSEGSALKSIRSFYIGVYSTNYSGLIAIQNLMKKLQIDTSKIYIDKRPKRKVFYFTIGRKKALGIFLNKIGFSIKRKQNRVKEYLNG